MGHGFFPENGLDRSLHAPILIGLFFVTFFTEAFGWTYAGLVVPGYLAALFVAAPFTGALTVAEALVTYGIVASIGQWAPKTGAWSTAFGRERFFLFIVTGVIVRYLVEGYVCPQLTARYPFEHSRELYSVGLVIVPLFANVFWNTGVRHAAPRLLVVTGLTYLVVKFVLLRYTNYSLSRFLIANESGALAFMASSKAQIILLVGALLGARSNVLYGWDYNGILVPALLGVAWYEPKKLAATLVEAVVVYALSAGLMAVPPFSRALVVGTRRMLVAGVVGFALKMALGFALLRYAPGVQLVDFLGFGYILPSLLAVKMWNKGHVGVVLMPTVQVSLTAFVAGNAVGFGLSRLRGGEAEGQVAVVAPPLAPRSAAFQLALGDVAPERPSRWSLAEANDRFRVGLELATKLRRSAALERDEFEAAKARHVRVTTHDTVTGPGWVVVTPQPVDPEVFEPAPRLAVRRAPAGAAPWVVVVRGPEAATPLFEASMQLAEQLDARAVIVLSRDPELAALDRRGIEALAAATTRGEGAARVITTSQPVVGPTAVVVAGAWPSELAMPALEQAVGHAIAVEWRPRSSSGGPLADAPEVAFSRADAERIGVARAGEVQLMRWQGSLERELAARLEGLTTTPALGPTPPGIDELRLYQAGVTPSLDVLFAGDEPSTWARVVAGRLGYRYARVGGDEVEAWVLHEPEGPDRRGHPTLVVRPGKVARPLLVEVPAPRWEFGAASSGHAMYEALSARALMIAGALPNADPTGRSDPRHIEGRRGYFQLTHESWLMRRANTLSVQGITPERDPGEDAILSTGRELAPDDVEPAWLAPVRSSLESTGFTVGRFDGARRHAPFGGGGDPTAAFAEKFAPRQHATLWLSPALRRRFALRDGVTSQTSDVSRLPPGLPTLDVARRAFELVACARAARPGAPALDHACPPVGANGCALDETSRRWRTLSIEHNPVDLREGLRAVGQGCAVEVARDRATGAHWATVASDARAVLVPVGGAPADRDSLELRDEDEVRLGVTMRVGALRVAP